MSLRLFVAVWPSEGLSARLRELARPTVAGVRWTTPDQWHVTLRFLGSVPDPAEVEAALATVAMPGPVRAEAGPSVARMSRSILSLPVAGLGPLAAAVQRATAGLGRTPEDRAFNGHLTLARARGGADVGALAGARVSDTWLVDEFSLVSSETHPQGARYTPIARYPI